MRERPQQRSRMKKWREKDEKLFCEHFAVETGLCELLGNVPGEIAFGGDE